MMQITQNVEMKELPKDASLPRTVTPELNGEEFRTPSPSQDMPTMRKNGLKRTTSQEGQDKELVNGQSHDIVDKRFTLSSSSDQERNAGTDLDALLDKISSIVDRSPKESNVHNEGNDSDNDHVEEDKIDISQDEDKQGVTKDIVEEPEVELSANDSGDEMLNPNEHLTQAEVVPKSKDSIEESIEEDEIAKSPNQKESVEEDTEKPNNGLEENSTDEVINQENKANANTAKDCGTAQEADVTIIDLDSSDEGVPDEVAKPTQEEDSMQEEVKEAAMAKDLEEKIEEGVEEMKEQKEEAERSEKSDVNDEELKSNGLVEADKAESIEQPKENEKDKDSSLEAEDDDDDVIFFELYDKGKEKETENIIKENDTKPEETTEKKAEPESETDKKTDEIVLVSEDEEEEEQLQTKKKMETEETNRTDKDFQADNSDNACDQFDKLKPQAKPKSLANEHHIDNNSNSSNLLRPAEDVELPPIKRKRLSNEETADATKTETATPETEKPPIAKRGHNLVEISPSEIVKEQTPNKKLKTDDSDSNSSNDGTLQIDLDAKEEGDESISPCKEEPEKQQVKPQLDTEIKPIRLEFVKTFRKSFDKMTRQDLEELVLQKVVEGMLVKSEFADIRRQLDKYEITLANYRRKIAEVSKQFVDLETVHKRVLKDLETKNSQFTAPVRITRAVGLQVGMSMKAMKSDVQGSSAAQSNAAGSNSTLSNSALPKASTSPLRSPLRGVQSGRSPHQHQQALQHPQQQPARPSPQAAPSSSSTPSSSFVKNLQPASSGSTPVRRGCMQKVTPQRPGPGHHIAQATTTSATGTPTNRSPQLGRPSLGVHASKHAGGGPAVPSAAAAAAAAAIRARSAAASYSNIASKQQQQYQTPRPGPGPSPNKSIAKMPSKVRAIPTVSVPISSAAAGGSQPNLAPAKPKDKSVIDLTDEDEAAAAAAAVQSRLSQSPASVSMKRGAAGPASVGGMNRPGSSGSGNVVRVSPMPGPACRTNVVSARSGRREDGGGQRNSMGSNVTMQIRSENTPPSAARLRYSHPAPLPSSPAQPFNPAWKLPPSRPVIRISLHDSGIVISWTLEDTSNRFADCVTYQIYAYQETIHEPSTDSWRHVGDVKAMLLPMAVTLNQFQENQRYYFAVRGVDDHQRFGPFSLPKTWT